MQVTAEPHSEITLQQRLVCTWLKFSSLTAAELEQAIPLKEPLTAKIPSHTSCPALAARVLLLAMQRDVSDESIYSDLLETLIGHSRCRCNAFFCFLGSGDTSLWLQQLVQVDVCWQLTQYMGCSFPLLQIRSTHDMLAAYHWAMQQDSSACNVLGNAMLQ